MNLSKFYESKNVNGGGFRAVTDKVKQYQEETGQPNGGQGRTREWVELDYGKLLQRGKFFVRPRPSSSSSQRHSVMEAIRGQLVHVKKNQKRKEKTVNFRKEGELTVFKSGNYDMMFVFREIKSSLPLLVFSKNIEDTKRLTMMLRGKPYLGQYCAIISPKMKDGGMDSLIVETDDLIVIMDADHYHTMPSSVFSSMEDQPGWKTFHLVVTNLHVEDYEVIEGCGHKECGGSHALDFGKNKELQGRCFAPTSSDNIGRLVIKANLLIEGVWSGGRQDKAYLCSSAFSDLFCTDDFLADKANKRDDRFMEDYVDDFNDQLERVVALGHKFSLSGSIYDQSNKQDVEVEKKRKIRVTAFSVIGDADQRDIILDPYRYRKVDIVNGPVRYQFQNTLAQRQLITPTNPAPAVNPAPVGPAPAVNPAPVVPASVIPAPVIPAAGVPVPINSAPIVPVPIIPAPVVPAPIIPAPVVPTPVVPAPIVPSTLVIPSPPVIPSTPVVSTPIVPTPVVPAPVVPTPVIPAAGILPTPVVISTQVPNVTSPAAVIRSTRTASAASSSSGAAAGPGRTSSGSDGQSNAKVAKRTL